MTEMIYLPSSTTVPRPVLVNTPPSPAPPHRIRSMKEPIGASSTCISLEHPLGSLRVGAHVGGDHAIYPARPDQLADADAGIVAVDRIDGGVFGSTVQQAVDEPPRGVAAGLTAHGDDLAIVEAGDDLIPGTHLAPVKPAILMFFYTGFCHNLLLLKMGPCPRKQEPIFAY